MTKTDFTPLIKLLLTGPLLFYKLIKCTAGFECDSSPVCGLGVWFTSTVCCSVLGIINRSSSYFSCFATVDHPSHPIRTILLCLFYPALLHPRVFSENFLLSSSLAAPSSTPYPCPNLSLKISLQTAQLELYL